MGQRLPSRQEAEAGTTGGGMWGGLGELGPGQSGEGAGGAPHGS